MKVGDTVVCVNAEETCQLREGKIYKIRAIKWLFKHRDHRSYKYVFLEELNVPGLEHVHYHVSHFRRIE